MILLWLSLLAQPLPLTASLVVWSFGIPGFPGTPRNQTTTPNQTSQTSASRLDPAFSQDLRSQVSFKAPPATFGRDRSPGRSSVKAPPSCREPRPPVKAPPPPPPAAPSSASEARGGAEEVSDGQLWMGKIMNQCSYGWISMLLLW